MRHMRGRGGIRINPNDLVKTTGRKELLSTQKGRLVVEIGQKVKGKKSQIQWWTWGEMCIGCMSWNVKKTTGCVYVTSICQQIPNKMLCLTKLLCLPMERLWFLGRYFINSHRTGRGEGEWWARSIFQHRKLLAIPFDWYSALRKKDLHQTLRC